MTPYKMQNLVYEGVDFSKFGQIWVKIQWLKFQKILEKIGNFVQNLVKNWADMNGLLFLEKLVFVWVYFQIPWRHIPNKTKLEYPPEMVVGLSPSPVIILTIGPGYRVMWHHGCGQS